MVSIRFPRNLVRQSSYIETRGGVCMKSLGFWSVLAVSGSLLALQPPDASAQDSGQHSVRQEFVSGGTIRLHLEAGGYTISPGDSENIVVTCRANSEEQLRRVKVAI